MGNEFFTGTHWARILAVGLCYQETRLLSANYYPKGCLQLVSEILRKLNFKSQDGRFWTAIIEGYAIDFLLRSTRNLTICFDHAGPARKKANTSREAWGYRFLEENFDHSGLFIKPLVSDWFRGKALLNLFKQLNEIGFFDKFDTVVNYGGSMGGYGAIAYADVCKAKSLLAYNPQATLKKDIVPWEKRFNWAPTQDWEGPLWNAADGCRSAQYVFVVFDPHHGNDRRHVAMLDVPSRVDLVIPYVGHRTPLHLANLGMSTNLFRDVTNGTFDLTEWNMTIRRRRSLEVYYQGLLRHAERRKHHTFLPIIEKYRAENLRK